MPTASDTRPVQSFVHALYNLASMTEYAEPLREEVNTCLGADQSKWTKDAFAKCWKLDSFLKESQRLNGLGARQSSSARWIPQKLTYHV